MRSHPKACLLAVLLASTASPRAARADERIVSILARPGACPGASAVAEKLSAILPHFRMAVGSDAAAHTVAIEDLGTSYRVTAAGIVRILDDPRRDCRDRARAAAVVAALAIDPPWVARRMPPPRAPAVRVYLDVAGAGEATVHGDGGAAASGGVVVRASAGTSWISVTVGLAAVTPILLDMDSGRVRLVRLPLDAGARFVWRRGRLEVGGDVGLALTPSWLAGEGVAETRGAFRLDVGLRAAPLVRIWLARRWALYLSADLRYMPFPYEMIVEPMGVIGTLPRLRLGGLVGVSRKLR